jgi:hypothetical protein
MAAKARSQAERFARIFDSLCEDIRTAPGEELLQSAHEAGRDPASTNVRLKSLLRSTFKAYQQKFLMEARQGYERELANISEGFFDLPKTAQGRRSWFVAALAQAPQLLPAFTLQNRELTDLSDEDIESHLKKLAQLGILKVIRLPEEE